MNTLTLAVDPGGSFLKGFSTLDSFKPELILMEPEVALVPKQSIELYERNKVGHASPEDEAWVEYRGEYRAVGYLAQRRFRADLQLKKRKFELALPKVLAMVGVLAQKHHLPNGTALRLGIVLPWGEYQDRATFRQLITEALASFKFRGKELSFVLDTFICLPEGGGVLTRGRAPGSSLREQVVYVVMLGFRDVSVLPVERGNIGIGCTEQRGMSDMIEAVKCRTGGMDTHKLLAAICKAGKGVNPKALTMLVETIDPAYRDNEISNIRTAISQAREEYWMLLSQWLRLRVPREADEVILAGGTANYFRAELNALFSYSQLNWCEELEKQLNNSFATQINAKSLHYRLTDAYGLFFYLCGTRSQAKGQSMSEWGDYRFRFKVEPDSLDDLLCRFLKAKDPDFRGLKFTEKELLLEPSSAYCLPLAFKRLQELGKCSQAEFKDCGRVSIYRLIQRVLFLAQVCGLEEELISVPLLRSYQPGYLVQGGNGIVGAAVGSPAVEIRGQPVPDLLHHQDDQTFEAMFGDS